MANKVKEAWRLFKVAVSFLTVFPTKGEWYPGDLGKASWFFPLVGFWIGLAVWGVWALLGWRTKDPLFSSLLALWSWVALTRGLHLDGVADVCDALFSGKDREERYRILKDPRVGTFGILGLFFTLGIKWVALRGIEDPFPFLFAPVLGRVGALFLGAFFSPLSPQGLGGEFVGRVPREAFFFWWALLLLWGWGGGGLAALLKTLLTFGIIFTLGRALSWGFGGVNGDILGAGIEWGEVIFLFLWRV